MNEVREEEKYERELDYQQLLFQQINRVSIISTTINRYTRADLRGLQNSIDALDSLLSPYWDTEYSEVKKRLRVGRTLYCYHEKGFHLLMLQFQALCVLMNKCGLLLHGVEEADIGKVEK